MERLEALSERYFLMNIYMKPIGICFLVVYSGDRSHNHLKATFS